MTLAYTAKKGREVGKTGVRNKAKRGVFRFLTRGEGLVPEPGRFHSHAGSDQYAWKLDMFHSGGRRGR